MTDETKRAQYVCAMEIIIRGLNDEDLIEPWLMNGVADGDLNDYSTTDDVIEMGYADEKTFKAITGTFLRIMEKAGKDGVYVGKVLADNKSRWGL